MIDNWMGIILNKLKGIKVQNDSLQTTLNTLSGKDFVEKSDLSELAKKSDLTSLAEKTDLSGLAKTSDLSNIGGINSCIRYIQRGMVSSSKNTITLSGFQNLNKMIVLINSAGTEINTYNGYAYASSACMYSISLTELRISCTTGSFSYQVIEFY